MTCILEILKVFLAEIIKHNTCSFFKKHGSTPIVFCVLTLFMSQVRFLEDFGSYARYLCRMILKLVFLCLKLLTIVFSKFLIGNLSMSEVTFSGFCKLHIVYGSY